MLCRVGVLAFLLAFLAAAQATVEYAGGAAHSVGSAGAAHSAGKSIAGALQKLGDKADSAAPKSQPRTAPASASRPSSKVGKPETVHASDAAAKPNEPPPVYEDASGIQAGLDGPTLLKRFGPPLLQFSDGNSETLSYNTKDGKSVDVTLADGKVTSVRKTGDTPVPAPGQLP